MPAPITAPQLRQRERGLRPPHPGVSNWGQGLRCGGRDQLTLVLKSEPSLLNCSGPKQLHFSVASSPLSCERPITERFAPQLLALKPLSSVC